MNKQLKVIIIIAVFIVGIWALSGYAIYNLGATERGTFGDMFGAINALFSGLAFTGLIYAVLLQSKELQLQREELSLTRNELTGSREAQEEQAKLLRASVELSTLNTLAQEATREEDQYIEKASLGTYKIGAQPIAELIEFTAAKRKAYVKRIEILLKIIEESDENT